MRPLIIDEKIQAHISAAVTRARQHVLNITDEEQLKLMALRNLPDGSTIKLSDRPKDWQRGSASENVLIPFGYRAAISFEMQPEPMGLCAHWSFSVDTPGRIPNEHAIKLVAKAFGLLKDNYPRRVWLEEFRPNHHAVNMVEPVEWPTKSQP